MSNIFYNSDIYIFDEEEYFKCLNNYENELDIFIDKKQNNKNNKNNNFKI